MKRKETNIIYQLASRTRFFVKLCLLIKTKIYVFDVVGKNCFSQAWVRILYVAIRCFFEQEFKLFSVLWNGWSQEA